MAGSDIYGSREAFGRQHSRRSFLRLGLGLGAAVAGSQLGLARAEQMEFEWVRVKTATPLWLDADGKDLRWLQRKTLLRPRSQRSNGRLEVWCPAFYTFGTVLASAVEDAPIPSETELQAQRVGPVLPSVEIWLSCQLGWLAPPPFATGPRYETTPL